MNSYVYLYLREDNTPYYVGKGMGDRAYSPNHNCEVPEVDRIIFVVENTTDEWACFMEKELIAEYGRLNDGTGILENLTDGGDGVAGGKWPEWDSRWGRDLRSGTDGAKRAGEKNKKLQQDPEWREWFLTRCVKSSLGVPVPEERKERISKTLGGDREWSFLSPENEVVTFKGSLNKWCIENNLNTGAMAQVHKGKVKHHKQWTNVNNPDTDRFVSPAKKISKTLGCSREWNFVSPDGETVSFKGSLNAWCSERKLNTSVMSQVHSGKTRQHKGWTKQ